jgi:colicin import membrane protein
MTGATLQRDALMPRPPGGMGPGLALALFIHGLLVVALAFGVHWHASEPEGVQAELWAAVPQIAAPPAAEPQPQPAPVRPEPAPPAPPPLPVARPQAVPDAQIAIEKARRDEAKRREQEKEKEKEAREAREEKDRAEKLAEARKKKEQADKLAQKQKLEQDDKRKKADEQKLAALHEQNVKRMLGQAGASGEPSSSGKDSRTAGPPAGYLGQVIAAIKPNMKFPPGLGGNDPVEVEIVMAPDGRILSSRRVKSSGMPEWDDAVVRAIGATETLPRDRGGKVWSPLLISWRPRD